MINKLKSLFLFFTVFVFLLSQNIHSQSISFSSEIIWKEKDLYILNYENSKVPFIKFTYKNNTCDSLYFYGKLTETDVFLRFFYEPPLISYVSGYSPSDPLDLLMDSIPDWSGREYDVSIDESQSFLYKANTKFSLVDIHRSREHEVLDFLTSILELQAIIDNIDSTLQYRYFHFPNRKIISASILENYFENSINKTLAELKEENVLLQLERDSMDNKLYPKGVSERAYNLIEKDILNQCVFLMPFAEYTVEFDLTPFFLLKGTYNLFTNKKEAPRIVAVSSKHILAKPHPLGHKKPLLPENDDNYFKYTLHKNHKGYKLYNGKINRTKVKIILE